MDLRRKCIAVLRRRSDGLHAVDIHVGFAQHAGGVERRDGIAAQVEAVLGAHLHDHFDGSQLLVFIWNNANR